MKPNERAQTFSFWFGLSAAVILFAVLTVYLDHGFSFREATITGPDGEPHEIASVLGRYARWSRVAGRMAN
jgi:hypothetical protein